MRKGLTKVLGITKIARCSRIRSRMDNCSILLIQIDAYSFALILIEKPNVVSRFVCSLNFLLGSISTAVEDVTMKRRKEQNSFKYHNLLIIIVLFCVVVLAVTSVVIGLYMDDIQPKLEQLRSVTSVALRRVDQFKNSEIDRLINRNINATKEIIGSFAGQPEKDISYFACTDNSNEKAILNDDYCDCKDGSDEPETSACSHLLPAKAIFNCNKLSYSHQQMIFLSRVNDRVIDCDNTADETALDVFTKLSGKYLRVGKPIY